VFASELKALLANPRLPRRISLAGLNHYLAFGYAPKDRCILEGYRKLPAGHWLTWHVRSGALSVEKFWNLPFPPKSSKRSIDDLTDELELHLSDAVRAQLLADVPVGVLLSGGLDSSLVTALAARSTSNKIRTYSVIFPGNSDHDESEHARLVSTFLGTEHHELPASENSIDILPKLVAQFDEPLADSSIIPTYMVSRLVRSGCTVALGGDGGDELFGGYLHYPWVCQIDRLRHLGIERYGLEHLISKTMKIGTPGRNVALSLVGRYPPEVTITRLLDPTLRQCLLEKSIAKEEESPEKFRFDLIAARRGAIDRQTALDFETYMCDDILAKVDRASMLNSLEIRAPFLDRKVIEFAFGTVPSTLKVKGFRRKLLLRKLALKLLPGEFDASRKKGFTVPLADWLRGAWKPLIDDLLNQGSPFFDRRNICELTATLQHSDRGANRIFQLALLEAWRRQYQIQL
jgi:asparagine synthase (glutamine-hydrolysing)